MTDPRDDPQSGHEPNDAAVEGPPPIGDAPDPPDVELVDQLRTLADRYDPVPADLLHDARAAFAVRNLDDELAELVFDSEVQPVGIRAHSSAGRQLSFHIEAGSIEVDIADGRLVGQVVPPAPGEVSLLAQAGPALVVEADEAGNFSFATPRRGIVRIRAHVAGRAVVTDWFTVSPT